MTAHESGLRVRLRNAAAAWWSAYWGDEKPCLHADERCIYCQRDGWADTAVTLKVKLQNERSGR